jgi:hypothetical protein
MNELEERLIIAGNTMNNYLRMISQKDEEIIRLTSDLKESQELGNFDARIVAKLEHASRAFPGSAIKVKTWDKVGDIQSQVEVAVKPHGYRKG